MPEEELLLEGAVDAGFMVNRSNDAHLSNLLYSSCGGPALLVRREPGEAEPHAADTHHLDLLQPSRPAMAVRPDADIYEGEGMPGV